MIEIRADPPSPPPVGAVAGPHLIGYFLNWGLFGVLCVQTFLYYLAFPRDKWTMKALVYGLMILDLVQTILITNDAFIKYGLEFTNVAALKAMRNAWFSIPTISAINGTAVQLFFAYRISTLSGSRILGSAVAITAIAGGAGGLATGIRSRIINDLSVVAVKARTELTIWLTISGASDVIIALCMVIILSRKKSGFNTRTDDAITKIIRLTVETGSLTAILAIITVVLFFSFPNRAYWNVPIDVLGKLYSNNLLVILNRRIKIVDGRNADADPTTHSTSLGNNHTHTFNAHHISSRVGPGEMPIKIQKEVWSNADDIRMDDMSNPAIHPYASNKMPPV